MFEVSATPHHKQLFYCSCLKCLQHLTTSNYSTVHVRSVCNTSPQAIILLFMFEVSATPHHKQLFYCSCLKCLQHLTTSNYSTVHVRSVCNTSPQAIILLFMFEVSATPHHKLLFYCSRLSSRYGRVFKWMLKLCGKSLGHHLVEVETG